MIFFIFRREIHTFQQQNKQAKEIKVEIIFKIKQEPFNTFQDQWFPNWSSGGKRTYSNAVQYLGICTLYSWSFFPNLFDCPTSSFDGVYRPLNSSTKEWKLLRRFHLSYCLRSKEVSSSNSQKAKDSSPKNASLWKRTNSSLTGYYSKKLTAEQVLHFKYILLIILYFYSSRLWMQDFYL